LVLTEAGHCWQFILATRGVELVTGGLAGKPGKNERLDDRRPDP